MYVEGVDNNTPPLFPIYCIRVGDGKYVPCLCYMPCRGYHQSLGDGEAEKGQLLAISLREHVNWGGTVSCTFMVNRTNS